MKENMNPDDDSIFVQCSYCKKNNNIPFNVMADVIDTMRLEDLVKKFKSRVFRKSKDGPIRKAQISSIANSALTFIRIQRKLYGYK